MNVLSKEEKLKILKQYEGLYIHYDCNKTYKRSYMILEIDVRDESEPTLDFCVSYIYTDFMLDIQKWDAPFDKIIEFIEDELKAQK